MRVKIDGSAHAKRLPFQGSLFWGDASKTRPCRLRLHYAVFSHRTKTAAFPCLYRPEPSDPALDGAQAGVPQAEQGVHFRRGVFIAAAGMMDKDVIRLADLPRRLHAEAAHRRGEREDPDGRADGHVLVSGKRVELKLNSSLARSVHFSEKV